MVWFRPRRAPTLRLAIEQGEPNLERFSGLRSAFITPRNVVYQGDEVTVIEYFGRAAIVIDRKAGSAVVRGDDPDLVGEAGTTFSSRASASTSMAGARAVHAIGLSGDAGSACVVMPSGGGKTRSRLRALGDERCRVLSEDRRFSTVTAGCTRSRRRIAST